MVLCNCCSKYGGRGISNTPYKKHIWDCKINDDCEYQVDWIKAVKSVEKIETFYKSHQKKLDER